MSRLYGWGASIVILGALFKIQHYPFAGLMLVVGMVTEAIVFFFSAFEPIHEEYNWALVYPELAGLDDVEPRKHDAHRLVSQNVTVSNTLDKLLEDANIGPELIGNLSKGLHNLSENAAKMADLSNAAVITNGYIQNVEAASKSVVELSHSYKNAAEFLKHDLSLSQEYGNSLKSAVTSMNQLSETYQKTAQTAKESLDVSSQFNSSIKNVTSYTDQLGESYSKNASLLTKAVEALEGNATSGKTYSEQLQKTANNLMALNAAYELQLQAAGNQSDSTEKLHKAVGSLVDNLNDSLSNTKQYKEEIEKLNANIRALNSVYGNMLSAMNFNTPR
ncbi:MAG: gliding motility protein GldL [Bacteroidales bacterium]|nr:gliding motility protein GldL [Bacteroidales bacterium]NLM92600.1 gliding motility protein GldL [Bacteroidales bacterium]